MCREFERSADFSDLCGEVSTCKCLGTDLPSMKRFLRFFNYPQDPDQTCTNSDKCRYRRIEPEIYQGASAEEILGALYDNGYISATNILLLRRIVKRFSCPKCQETLQKYTEKYPPCTVCTYS